MFEHSPERDEEVFKELTEAYESGRHRHIKPSLLVEVVAIAKKWRAKANMRAARIEELETLPPVDDKLKAFYEEIVQEQKAWEDSRKNT